MNSMVLAGLVFVAVLAVGFGEICTPDQWEGSEGSTGGYVHHRHPGMVKEYSQVSYDAKNSRKAMKVHYERNEKKYDFDIVVRYDDDVGKAYIFNKGKETCWVKTLKKPFTKACIPADAKRFDFSLGLKGKGGFPVSNYLVKKDKVEVSVTASVIGNQIIPVGESMHGYKWGTAFILTAGFFDITPGIKNETVFDIPKGCEKEMELEEDLPDRFLNEYTVLGF